MRRAGVRPARQQPGRPAHHGRRADPGRRLQADAARPHPAGILQHLPPLHHRQLRRPQGPEARPRAPSPSLGRRRPADGRARRASLASGGGRTGRRGPRSPGAVRRLVRPGLGVRGAPAEPPARRHRPQQEAGRARSGGRRTGGRHERRPLPRPGTLTPPGRAGRRKAQHHHRPGAAAPPSQPSPAPEVPRRDGEALRRVARGRLQHPACSGAVHIRPQHGPRLHPAGPRRAGRTTRPRATCGGSATRRRRGATDR